jgi:threonine dehydrogenase-like Zn-dependent dehydrogenase
VKALVFGVRPDPDALASAESENDPLLRGLARVPMQLRDIDDAKPLFDDWVVVKPRLTGICGSDAKQIFDDFGIDGSESPSAGFFSMPQVLGHEVVGDVVSVGPAVSRVSVGQRVVLDPWLGCRPRGIDPICPSCAAGDNTLCDNFAAGRLSPGIHSGTSSDATGGYAEALPAHETMVHVVPDNVPDEVAVLADPFSVSLHGIVRNPPPAGGRALVYGAGSLGSMAIAVLRALYPDVRIAVVAAHAAQADLAKRLGADVVFEPEPRLELVEALADWSDGVIVPAAPKALPMAWPGGIDVVYDTISKGETLEVATRVVRSRGTVVQLGMHGPSRWENTPIFHKEIALVGSNAFGIETVEGRRAHAMEHFLRLAAEGRLNVDGVVTHRFGLDEWRTAFATLATQHDTGAVKVAFDYRSAS